MPVAGSGSEINFEVGSSRDAIELGSILLDLCSVLCVGYMFRNRVNVRSESSKTSGGRLHGIQFTQFFLKQSWEQKKLSLPCSLHLGHWRVSASFGQSSPAQWRFGGLCTSTMVVNPQRCMRLYCFHRKTRWKLEGARNVEDALDWRRGDRQGPLARLVAQVRFRRGGTNDA